MDKAWRTESTRAIRKRNLREGLSKRMQNEAWMDEEKRIVSFHEIPNSRYYSAGEHDFWQMIVSLILAGYRVQ